MTEDEAIAFIRKTADAEGWGTGWDRVSRVPYSTYGAVARMMVAFAAGAVAAERARRAAIAAGSVEENRAKRGRLLNSGGSDATLAAAYGSGLVDEGLSILRKIREAES